MLQNIKIYLKRGVSAPLAISIIFILFFLLLGFIFWNYSKISTEQSGHLEIRQPEGKSEITEPELELELEGLVVYYRFNEANGYDIKDFSENQNHGSFYTTAAEQQKRFYYPKWRRGLEGNALEFNYNSFFEIPNSSSLDFDKSEGTIEMWVQPHWFCDLPFVDYFEEYGKNCTPSAYQRLMIDENWQIELGIDPKKNLYFYPCRSSSINYNLTKKPLENFKWNHIAVTWDFLNKEVNFYINGEKVENDIENVATYWDKIAETGNLQIGGTILDISSKFEGLIDEMRIYNRKLSEEEIKNNYQLIERGKDVVDDSFKIIDVSILSVEKNEEGYIAGDIKLEEVEREQPGRLHYFKIFYKDKEIDEEFAWDEYCSQYPEFLTFHYRGNKYIFFETCSYGSGGAWDFHCLYLIDQKLNTLQPVLPGKEGPDCFCFNESMGFRVIGYKNFIFIVSGANYAAGVSNLYQGYRIDIIEENNFMGSEEKTWEIAQ